MRCSDPPTSQINQSYQTRLTMKKWDAEKFTINARLKILTRLLLNRVNRRVNAINPAALVFTCEVAYQKSLKSVHICKSYCEKQMPLFYLDTVYIAM